MPPSPQGLSGITHLLGGAAAPAGVVSSIAAAATANTPALVSSIANNLPVASGVPVNVPVSGNALPNIAIPTGSVLEVTALTTAPLTATAAISSLAALPINSNVSGLGQLLEALNNLPLPTETLASDLPLSLLPTNIINLLPSNIPLNLPLNAPLSALPSGVQESLPSGLPPSLPIAALPIQVPSLPSGLPLVPLQAISPVQAILASLGGSLITQLTTQLSNIITTIASAAAQVSAAQDHTALLSGLGRTTDTKAEDEEGNGATAEKRQLGHVLGGLTGSSAKSPLASLGALTGVTSALSGGILANSNPLGFLTGQSGDSVNAGVQGLGGGLSNGLGLVGNEVNPLIGIQTTVQGAVSGTAGGAASGQPLGALTGLVSGLSLSGGPLSTVTGVLGNLGLGSIVLKVINSLPIPTSLNNIITSLATAISTPISLLLSTGQLTQLQSTLGLLNLFSTLNIGNFGVLSSLTNLPAIQNAASFLNTQDLLTTLSFLRDPALVPSGVDAGTLLSKPQEFLNVVQKLVPLVSNPSAATAFLILEQLNLGGLADLTTALPVSGVLGGVSGSVIGNVGVAGGFSGALGGLMGSLSGGASAGASAGAGASVVGAGRMMESEGEKEEVSEE